MASYRLITLATAGITLVLALGSVGPVFAQTTINTDETLPNATRSSITGDVTVADGVKLTINDGGSITGRVEVDRNAELTVNTGGSIGGNVTSAGTFNLNGGSIGGQVLVDGVANIMSGTIGSVLIRALGSTVTVYGGSIFALWAGDGSGTHVYGGSISHFLARNGGTIDIYGCNLRLNPVSVGTFYTDYTLTGTLQDGTVLNSPARVNTGPGFMSSSIQFHSVDVRAPVIGPVSATPAQLWPPTRQMVLVTLDYSVSDDCSAAANTALTVSSNEPGNGNTGPDWQVVDAKNVYLRAEPSGKEGGRIYTITITATDPAGNIATRQVTVPVARP